MCVNVFVEGDVAGMDVEWCGGDRWSSAGRLEQDALCSVEALKH